MHHRSIGIHKPAPPPASPLTRLLSWLLLKAGAGLDVWQRGGGAVGGAAAGPCSSAFDDPPDAAAAFASINQDRFERLVRTLFEQPGLTTTCPAGRGAPGVDVWLFRPQRGPQGTAADERLPVTLVQCRHWPGKRIGVERVRALWAVMAVRHVPRGQLVTSASLTEEAVAFALDHRIETIDASALFDLVRAHPVARALAGPAFQR